MKIYIAARFGEKERVQDLYKKFQDKGHEISIDWTTHKSIKPYEDHPGLACSYSVEDINGAKNCDVFIILTDEAGTGMYVELGIAIASNLERGKPDIYAVGEFNSRCMFYFYPSIKCVNSIEDVLKLR